MPNPSLKPNTSSGTLGGKETSMRGCCLCGQVQYEVKELASAIQEGILSFV